MLYLITISYVNCLFVFGIKKTVQDAYVTRSVNVFWNYMTN